MDASQYKGYVLFLQFIKYISDKYGDSDDKINTQIISPLVDANARLSKSDFPDFNDPNKLGEGKDMVEKLSNLVGIFQKPELDFSQIRAEHDDIQGDA